MSDFKRRQVSALFWLVMLGMGGLSVGSHWSSAAASSEEETATPTTRKVPPRSVKKPTTTSNLSDSEQLQRKLNEIIENQKTILTNQNVILQKFDAVMEELRAIKIRSTLAGH